MNRAEILGSAAKCVCDEREEQYGSPEYNLGAVAAFWTTYIRTANNEHITALDPEDVCMMLVMLKVGRIASGRTQPDNYVDLAGYAALAGEIATTGMGDGRGTDLMKSGNAPQAALNNT